MRRLDGFISMTRVGHDLTLQKFPVLSNVPGFIIPHGHYRDVFENHVTREQARSILGLEGKSPVVVHIGAIRPYKNVPLLIRCFSGVKDPNAALLVAGQTSTSMIEEEVRNAARADRRVRLSLGIVPADSMQLYLNAADLVVLPYSKIHNSGNALLALSFDRPVLLPKQPTMLELQEQMGGAWIRTFAPPLTEDNLSEALEWARSTQRPRRAPTDCLDWPRIARQTMNAYRASGVAQP
jgi:glycosyltransferase involved in cell wall biosynthesis